MNQPKSQNQIKLKITNKFGETRIQTYQNWLQEFRENLVDEGVPEHRDSHASSSHEPSLEPMGSVDLVKHSIETHFQKDRNCDICQRTKITTAPCRRRIGRVVPRAENFGDLITADHKIVSEGCESRNNHRYAVAVQDLASQWIQSYPCKNKTSQETQRSLQKFLEPHRKPTVIYTDNSLEFGKACEDLSWNHCTSTPTQIRNKRDCWKSSAQSERRYNQVWMRNGGQIPWNAEPICGTFKISCQMGRHHMKDALENLLKDQLSRLVHWLSITLSLRRTSQESISLERKSYLEYSLDTFCTRREFGCSYGCRHWWAGDDGRIGNLCKRRLNAKEVIFSKEKGIFIFPVADGRKKFVGWDQELRTSTLIRDHPIQREDQRDVLGESEVSPPPPPQDSLPDAGEAINDFCFI